jgi:hypothetical protein
MMAGSTGVALLLAAASVVAQTTTGRLIGTVVDEAGRVLPGVTVTIASPALIGGGQTGVTDTRGEFSFVGIAPGEYKVMAELTGFVPQERAQVKVSLGHAVSLTIVMPQGTFSGEIEIVYETPVVDPTQVNTGQIFDESYLEGSAIGSVNRAYNIIVNWAAGVAISWAGVPQPRVFGSTAGENAYFIDGMDITDPVTATTNLTMNFDAIAEIQLQTGGFEAEYGRATGGIINLVTRSGGNRFSGTIDVRYRDESFQESGNHLDTTELDTSFEQYSFTLGGPILRDRVWFFAAYERNGTEFTPVDSLTTRHEKGQNSLAKMTWQIDDGWRLTGRYSSDPSSTDNFNASRWVMPEAAAYSTGRTAVVSGELSSVLSDSLLWNTTVGQYTFDTEKYPQSGNLATIAHHNSDTGLRTHNYSEQAYWSSRRYDLSTDLTWFVDNLAGSHEFKAGIEYSDLGLFDDGLCATGTPNGERCVEGVPGFLFEDIDDGGPFPWFMWEKKLFSEADYRGVLSSAFVQDAWRLTRDLTLKAGFRYDAVTYDDNEGARVADMSMLQPRIGLAWDLTGNAKNVLRGSWGRFMHPNAVSLPGWVTTLETELSKWWSCSGAVPYHFEVPVTSPEECAAVAAFLGYPYRLDNEGWDPYGWMLPPWMAFGSEQSRIVPNLRATHADELILAFEREVGKRASVELSFVDKRTRDIVEDTCNGNVPTPSEDAECDYFVFANLPELRRDYRALMVRYETRGLDWLTLLASYTWSTSEGSIEYWQNNGNVADHFPWHFHNRYGYLSDHRNHRFKLNGFFTLKSDWTIAFSGVAVSPFTWTPWENSHDNSKIPYDVHYLEPRGNRNGDSYYQVDLQISKGFTMRQVRLVLIGSAYNAFSNEQPVAVCAHFSGCGEDFEMGDPVAWQQPRRYELGLRVEF